MQSGYKMRGCFSRFCGGKHESFNGFAILPAMSTITKIRKELELLKIVYPINMSTFWPACAKEKISGIFKENLRNMATIETWIYRILIKRSVRVTNYNKWITIALTLRKQFEGRVWKRRNIPPMFVKKIILAGVPISDDEIIILLEYRT